MRVAAALSAICLVLAAGNAFVNPGRVSFSSRLPVLDSGSETIQYLGTQELPEKEESTGSWASQCLVLGMALGFIVSFTAAPANAYFVEPNIPEGNKFAVEVKDKAALDGSNFSNQFSSLESKLDKLGASYDVSPRAFAPGEAAARFVTPKLGGIVPGSEKNSDKNLPGADFASSYLGIGK